MPKAKIKIELTGAQIKYLSSALFEFGETFDSVKKEYMFKRLTNILDKAFQDNKKQEEFYAENKYLKTAIKGRRL